MKQTEVVLEKGFFYVKGMGNQEHAFIGITDGNYYVYQGKDAIEVVSVNAYNDISLYLDPIKVTFDFDPKRARGINEHFGPDTFDNTCYLLADYLTLFKDTLQNTQFARTTLSDQEVKECTDAIFTNPSYKELDLDTDYGKDKLYELQYFEYEKRDETMSIPFDVDNPNWKPEDLSRKIEATILKPVVFTNPVAQFFFGNWYKGEVGNVIMMNDQHFTLFQHRGCVKFAHPTKSGKVVSGTQMTYDGFTKCEDDTLWKMIIEEIETKILATDREGVTHLFQQHGNEWFSYLGPIDK